MTNEELQTWWNSFSVEGQLEMESLYLFGGDFDKYPDKYKKYFPVGVVRKVHERWQATKDMT